MKRDTLNPTESLKDRYDQTVDVLGWQLHRTIEEYVASEKAAGDSSLTAIIRAALKLEDVNKDVEYTLLDALFAYWDQHRTLIRWIVTEWELVNDVHAVIDMGIGEKPWEGSGPFTDLDDEHAGIAHPRERMGYLAQVRQHLVSFAKEHGLRDWHRPQGQGVSALVTGHVLNDVFDTRQIEISPPITEQVVWLMLDAEGENAHYTDRKIGMSVNLLALLAIASSDIQGIALMDAWKIDDATDR